MTYLKCLAFFLPDLAFFDHWDLAILFANIDYLISINVDAQLLSLRYKCRLVEKGTLQSFMDKRSKTMLPG